MKSMRPVSSRIKSSKKSTPSKVQASRKRDNSVERTVQPAIKQDQPFQQVICGSHVNFSPRSARVKSATFRQLAVKSYERRQEGAIREIRRPENLGFGQNNNVSQGRYHGNYAESDEEDRSQRPESRTTIIITEKEGPINMSILQEIRAILPGDHYEFDADSIGEFYDETPRSENRNFYRDHLSHFVKEPQRSDTNSYLSEVQETKRLSINAPTAKDEAVRIDQREKSKSATGKRSTVKMINRKHIETPCESDKEIANKSLAKKYGTLSHMEEVKRENLKRQERIKLIQSRTNLYAFDAVLKKSNPADSKLGETLDPHVYHKPKRQTVKESYQKQNESHGITNLRAEKLKELKDKQPEFSSRHQQTTKSGPEERIYSRSNYTNPLSETISEHMFKQQPQTDKQETLRAEPAVTVEYFNKINADNAKILRRLDDILITIHKTRPDSPFKAPVSNVVYLEDVVSDAKTDINDISSVDKVEYTTPVHGVSEVNEDIKNDACTAADSPKRIPTNVATGSQSQILQPFKEEKSVQFSKSSVGQNKEPATNKRKRKTKCRSYLPLLCCIADSTVPCISPVAMSQRLSQEKYSPQNVHQSKQELEKSTHASGKEEATDQLKQKSNVTRTLEGLQSTDKNNNKRAFDRVTSENPGKDKQNMELKGPDAQGIIKEHFNGHDNKPKHVYYEINQTTANTCSKPKLFTLKATPNTHAVSEGMTAGNASAESGRLPERRKISSDKHNSTAYDNQKNIHERTSSSQNVGNLKLEESETSLSGWTLDPRVRVHSYNNVTRKLKTFEQATDHCRENKASSAVVQAPDERPSFDEDNKQDIIRDPRRFGSVQHYKQAQQQNAVNRSRLRQVTSKLDTWQSQSTLECLDAKLATIQANATKQKTSGPQDRWKTGTGGMQQLPNTYNGQQSTADKPKSQRLRCTKVLAPKTDYLPSWNDITARETRASRNQTSARSFKHRQAATNSRR